MEQTHDSFSWKHGKNNWTHELKLPELTNKFIACTPTRSYCSWLWLHRSTTKDRGKLVSLNYTVYGAKNAFLARNKYQIHQSKTCRNHGLSSCTPGRKRDEHLSCDHLSRIALRNHMKWLPVLVTLLYETSLQHNDHRICSGEPTQQHSSSSAPLSRWRRVRESPAIASQLSYIFLHI